jgi:ribonuclease BN (tRNA processing enzyme)
MSLTVNVIGCGEALDPALANSAVVVEADGYRALVDCGHSVPRPLVAAFPDAEAIDAVLFTHLHPDHCFGFIPMLIEWTDQGRKKPLTVVTTADGRRRLTTLGEVGLTPFDRLPYPLIWPSQDELRRLGPFDTAFARTQHSVVNHALRLSAGGTVFAYSGDGRPTDEAVALYRLADLLLQECYARDAAEAGQWHCDVDTARAAAHTAGVDRLVLYHVRRDQRPLLEAKPGVVLAKPGDRFRLSRE